MLVTTPSRPATTRPVPATTRPVPARTRPPVELSDPIPTRWALTAIVALVGANVAAALLEPLPANPAAAQPWFIPVLSMIVTLAMLAALGGLLTRQRWGLGMSALAGGISVLMVLGCPLSGHHHFGLWWVGEIAAVAAWTGISLAGLRSAPNRQLSDPAAR
jgi:hypothetical protein